jgi:hypothetical protein
VLESGVQLVSKPFAAHTLLASVRRALGPESGSGH